jgi:hypothetical protein
MDGYLPISTPEEFSLHENKSFGDAMPNQGQRASSSVTVKKVPARSNRHDDAYT